MTALDATGLFALEEVAKTLHASKRTLIVCGARMQPAQLIHQGEFSEVVGPENICDNVQEALRRAEEVYERLEAKFVARCQLDEEISGEPTRESSRERR
jgi:MFS superfamily sulfate permease-like transporter